MSNERLFLDTTFIQGLLNKKDQWHQHAKALETRAESAYEVIVTEAVLLEVGNALSGLGEQLRKAANDYIQKCYLADNIRVVPFNTELLTQGLAHYNKYKDKTWGLVDCISFVVMKEEGLTSALTYDEDFVQAEFHALMRDIVL